MNENFDYTLSLDKISEMLKAIQMIELRKPLPARIESYHEVELEDNANLTLELGDNITNDDFSSNIDFNSEVESDFSLI